jgi:hypothetical protein
MAARGVPSTPRTLRLGKAPPPCLRAVGGRDRGLCVRSKICKCLRVMAPG